MEPQPFALSQRGLGLRKKLSRHKQNAIASDLHAYD